MRGVLPHSGAPIGRPGNNTDRIRFSVGGVEMEGIGWQEGVIVLMLLVIYLLPVIVVARGSERRTGRVSVGWVLVALLFSWIGALAWAVLGAKTPYRATEPGHHTNGQAGPGITE